MQGVKRGEMDWSCYEKKKWKGNNRIEQQSERMWEKEGKKAKKSEKLMTGGKRREKKLQMWALVLMSFFSFSWKADSCNVSLEHAHRYSEFLGKSCPDCHLCHSALPLLNTLVWGRGE